MPGILQRVGFWVDRAQSRVLNHLRDPPLPELRLRRQGAQIVMSFEEPSFPGCPIELSFLIFEDHRPISDIRRTRAPNPDVLFNSWGLGNLENLLAQQGAHDTVARCINLGINNGIVRAHTVEATLIIDFALRYPGGGSMPHVGPILVAIFERAHTMIQDLREIFVNDISNRQTRELLMTYGAGIHTFNRGDPEYDAVIGTRIGRTVGSVVWSGYRRGSRRISRIAAARTREGHWNLRFDIESSSEIAPIAFLLLICYLMVR